MKMATATMAAAPMERAAGRHAANGFLFDGHRAVEAPDSHSIRVGRTHHDPLDDGLPADQNVFGRAFLDVPRHGPVLSRMRSLLLALDAVLPLETFDAAGCVDQLLLSRKERMASGADFQGNFLLSGTGFKLVPARTAPQYFWILW